MFENILDIKKIQLALNKKKLILGLSGGPDSVFLFHLLISLKKNNILDFICAHVNYNLREKDSISDMQFCIDLCKTYKIPLKIKNIENMDYNSVQEKARDIRYSFFYDLLEEECFDYIALAHNRDDNIETVLFNLSRGAGIDGVCGMSFIENKIVRPILEIDKNRIENILKSNSFEFCTDKSNKGIKYNRNRIRLNIIPEFKKVNNGFYDNITRYISNMRVQKKINNLFNENIYNENILKKEKLYFLKNSFFDNDIDIQKNFFFFFIKEILNIRNSIYANNIEELLKIKKCKQGKRISIGKIELLKDIDYTYIYFKEDFNVIFPDFEEEELSCLSHSDHISFSNELCCDYANEILIDKNKIKWPIRLRHRKNGDRISQKSMLKKRFIDKKINKVFRDRVPVIEDADNNIIWVPGIYRKKFDEYNYKLIYSRRLFWLETIK